MRPLKYLDSHYTKEPRLVHVTKTGWEFYLNELGWRINHKPTPVDWKLEDLNNSVVFIGCSQTFGQYINIEHTMAHKLQEQEGVPTINLGIPAGSLEWMFIKTIELLENYKPRAIVFNYTSIDRYLLWHTGGNHSPAWENKSLDHLDKWVLENPHQLGVKATYLRDCLQLLCKSNNIPTVEISWNIWWKNRFKDVHFIDRVDIAIDGYHWGEKTNQKALDDVIVPSLVIKGILG